jgi:hypothetical protein
MALSDVERNRRYRHRVSMERESWYLEVRKGPEWQRKRTGRQRATHKRWWIFYSRRRALRLLGIKLPQPDHGGGMGSWPPAHSK